MSYSPLASGLGFSLVLRRLVGVGLSTTTSRDSAPSKRDRFAHQSGVFSFTLLLLCFSALSATPMPPKNRRSAAFSKVHKCHARPAAQMKATIRLSNAPSVVVFEHLCVVSLRKSHLLIAIGVVSSSAIAATLRGVKRARQLSPASLGRRVVQFQRDSPMRFFFLLSSAAVGH